MLLVNESKNLILSTDLKEAKTFFDRFFGMLNKSNPRFMFFRTRFGIHTFFLSKPIDVLVLNNKLEVVKIMEKLKPYKLFFWNPIFDLIIELPGDTIRKTNLKVGDKLKITY